MEQHKVLLIIVSVTILLAAIIGIGLWLFYPRNDAAEELAGAPTGEGGGFEWQPLDYLQGEGDVPGLEEQPPAQEQPDEFQVTYGVAENGEESANAQPPALVTEESRPAGSRGGAVQGPAGTAPAAGEESAPAPSAGPAAQTQQTPAQQTPAPSSRPAPSAAVAVESSPAAAAEQKDQLSDRAYWVQAISSPNRDTVEQAQKTLREHELGSRILTKTINDRTYFRLRVGPFAVRAEAEKFLGWVQAIDGFADAMIFVDYTTPVLAARPQ